jgi:hypothetical protein
VTEDGRDVDDMALLGSALRGSVVTRKVGRTTFGVTKR